MEEMPRKSAAELEAECLRLLAMDPHTRGIKRVEIIRMYPKGTGPNWTYGALDPMPTRAGVAIAQTRLSRRSMEDGRWQINELMQPSLVGAGYPPYVRLTPVWGPFSWLLLAAITCISLWSTAAKSKSAG